MVSDPASGHTYEIFWLRLRFLGFREPCESSLWSASLSEPEALATASSSRCSAIAIVDDEGSREPQMERNLGYDKTTIQQARRGQIPRFWPVGSR